MARLNRQYRASCGQIRLVGDGRCCTQVRRDADAFEDRGKLHEGLGILAGEGKGRLLDGGIFKSTGEKRDVCLENVRVDPAEHYTLEADAHLLIEIYFLQILVKVLGEPGLAEVALGVVRQALLIELSLEILECQGIVEDGDITSWRRIKISAWLEGSRDRR